MMDIFGILLLFHGEYRSKNHINGHFVLDYRRFLQSILNFIRFICYEKYDKRSDNGEDMGKTIRLDYCQLSGNEK